MSQRDAANFPTELYMFVCEDDLNYIWELPLLFITDLTSPQHLQAVLGIRDIFFVYFFLAVATLSTVLKIQFFAKILC